MNPRTSDAYSEAARKGWEKRRQRDDFRNSSVIRPDGTLRPDTYRDDPETGCRIWLLSCTSSGTPHCGINGEHLMVRRELWRIHRGDPGDKGVGTWCNNHRCVALDHMALGTCSYGLNITQQRVIAGLGHLVSSSELAKRLGVSYVTVLKHRTFKGWIPHHQINRRYTETGMPSRPAGVSDRDWNLASYSLHRSLQQTGDEFGLTRERARQIIDIVLRAIDQEAERIAS